MTGTSALWQWLNEETVLAIHSEQLDEHGGGRGIRDIGLLQSALARPLNLHMYESPDCADLAAAYAFGISKNHPFVDGNKRTAFVVAETFIMINGYLLSADDVECVLIMLKLAEGGISEGELASWFREYIAAGGLADEAAAFDTSPPKRAAPRRKVKKKRKTKR